MIDNYSSYIKRHKYQLDFIKRKEEIQIGNIQDLPLEIDQLLNTTENSSFVEETFNSGLTAYIYKIKGKDRYWTLKKRRENILVKNVDGQTSFLNEVQRRYDFDKLKKDSQKASFFKVIVDTIYASLNKGIILSPWIEGQHIRTYNEPVLESIFDTIYHLDIEGFFEWDLCAGNILEKDNKIVLYDFGYMYRFNPLIEFNSEGRTMPIFHGAERFETRSYFQYLMDIETDFSMTKVLRELRMEKELALKYYIKKLKWLENNKADRDIIDWIRNIISQWEKALSSTTDLEALYVIESFRSYVLDLLDDVGGKSCQPHTIIKAEKILYSLKHNFSLLKEKKSFFFGDEKMTQEQLIEQYSHKKILAEKWQIRT